MVGIIDARQPVIIVVVGDGLAFLGKVGCLLRQHIAECIIGKGGDAACRMVHLGATELALSDTIIPMSVCHNPVHSLMIISFY